MHLVRNLTTLALSLAVSLAVCLAMGALAVPSGAGAAEQHGIAVGTSLKYARGFDHFDYANPKAPKGGRIVLSAPGSFDKLNPFSLKGREAPLLGGLLFEPLTEGALDEPIAAYGLLAQSLDVAEDRLSSTYKLNPQARWADGKPVTADDVVFSFEVLRSEAATPFYRYYYEDVTKVEALDKLTVRLGFAKKNPELALITGQLPILPKHFYGGKSFADDFNTSALGSGPYTVKSYDFGKSILFARNPEYWARNLNVNVGKNNFDEILVKFYRDDVVRLEGLKAGEFDFLDVNSSKQWATDVAGEKWDKRWIVKETLEHHNTAGMQGFALNTRRPLFQDRKVRRALALAFDFEWSNKTLFYGQYTESRSYFNNSELAATGLPTQAELALLNLRKEYVPPEVFTVPMGAEPGPARDSRDRLREAVRLLNEAGYQLKDGVLTHKTSGLPFRFTVTLVQPAFQRIVEPYLANLRKLGIQADMKVVDDSVYERQWRVKDFDVIVESFGQSQSPGNEQRDYWHSSSADVEGSRNAVGIKNPAVDLLVDAIIRAPTRQDLLTATHALDRVLWFEHVVVPHWYIAYHRVAYWNKFSYPKTLPLYYAPTGHLMFWWFDAAKDKALQAAMSANKALPAGN